MFGSAESGRPGSPSGGPPYSRVFPSSRVGSAGHLAPSALSVMTGPGSPTSSTFASPLTSPTAAASAAAAAGPGAIARSHLRDSPAEARLLGRGVMSPPPASLYSQQQEEPRVPPGMAAAAAVVDASLPTAESLATPAAIEARRALRGHPTVQAWLSVFWRTFPTTSSAGITKQQYLSQHALMYKALHTTYDPEALYAAGLTDWARDVWFSSSTNYLDEASFGDALFEVADLWTLTLDADEYVHFLADLFHRITDLRSWIEPNASRSISTKYTWKKLKYVACAQVYSGFQYKSIKGGQWKEAVDVAHLLEDQRGDRTMHPHGQDSLAAQAKARAQGLFKGASGPAAFAHFDDDEDEDEDRGPHSQLTLDPTQILSLMPPPPLEPPSVEFLSPPVIIPTHPRGAMFSNPLRELGLVVLNTAEDDDALDGVTDSLKAKKNAPAPSAAPAEPPVGDENAQPETPSAAGVVKKKSAKGKQPVKKGGKKKGAKSSSDSDSDSEPTAEELEQYLRENSAATGVSLPKGSSGREASVKAVLLAHARVVLKQRKRDQIIALAGQFQGVLNPPEQLLPQIVVADPAPPGPPPTQTMVSIEFGAGTRRSSFIQAHPSMVAANGPRVAQRSPEELAKRKAEYAATLRAEEDALHAGEYSASAERLQALEQKKRDAMDAIDRAYLQGELPPEHTIGDNPLPAGSRAEGHGHSRRFSFFGFGRQAAVARGASVSTSARRSIIYAAGATSQAGRPTLTKLLPLFRKRANSWPSSEMTAFNPALALTLLPARPPPRSTTDAAGVYKRPAADSDDDDEHIPTRTSPLVKRPSSGGSRPMSRRPSMLGSLNHQQTRSPALAGFGLSHRRSVLHSSNFGLTNKPPPFLALAMLKEWEPSTGFTARQRTASIDKVEPEELKAKRKAKAAAVAARATGPSVDFTTNPPLDLSDMADDEMAAQDEVDDFVSSLDAPKRKGPKHVASVRAKRQAKQKGVTLAALREDGNDDEVDPGIVIDPTAVDMFDSTDVGVRFDTSALDAALGYVDETEECMTGTQAGCSSPTPLGVLAQYRRVDAQRALALEWHWGRMGGKQRLIASLGPTTAQDVLLLDAQFHEDNARLMAKKQKKKAAKASAARAKKTAQKQAELNKELSNSIHSVIVSAGLLPPSEDPFTAIDEEQLDDDQLLDLEASLADDWESVGALWAAKYEKRWKSVVLQFMAIQAAANTEKEIRRSRLPVAEVVDEAAVLAAERAFWSTLGEAEVQKRLDKQLVDQLQKEAAFSRATSAGAAAAAAATAAELEAKEAKEARRKSKRASKRRKTLKSREDGSEPKDVEVDDTDDQAATEPREPKEKKEKKERKEKERKEEKKAKKTRKASAKADLGSDGDAEAAGADATPVDPVAKKKAKAEKKERKERKKEKARRELKEPRKDKAGVVIMDESAPDQQAPSSSSDSSSDDSDHHEAGTMTRFTRAATSAKSVSATSDGAPSTSADPAASDLSDDPKSRTRARRRATRREAAAAPVPLTADEEHARLVAADAPVEEASEFVPPVSSEAWSGDQKRAYRETELALDRQSKLLTMHAEGEAAIAEFQWAMKKEDIKEQEGMVDMARLKVDAQRRKEEADVLVDERRRVVEQKRLERVADDSREAALADLSKEERQRAKEAAAVIKKAQKRADKAGSKKAKKPKEGEAAGPSDTEEASKKKKAKKKVKAESEKKPAAPPKVAPVEHAPAFAFSIPAAPYVEPAPEPEPEPEVVEPEPEIDPAVAEAAFWAALGVDEEGKAHSRAVSIAITEQKPTPRKQSPQPVNQVVLVQPEIAPILSPAPSRMVSRAVSRAPSQPSSARSTTSTSFATAVPVELPPSPHSSPPASAPPSLPPSARSSAPASAREVPTEEVDTAPVDVAVDDATEIDEGDQVLEQLLQQPREVDDDDESDFSPVVYRNVDELGTDEVSAVPSAAQSAVPTARVVPVAEVEEDWNSDGMKTPPTEANSEVEEDDSHAAGDAEVKSHASPRIRHLAAGTSRDTPPTRRSPALNAVRNNAASTPRSSSPLTVNSSAAPSRRSSARATASPTASSSRRNSNPSAAASPASRHPRRSIIGALSPQSSKKKGSSRKPRSKKKSPTDTTDGTEPSAQVDEYVPSEDDEQGDEVPAGDTSFDELQQLETEPPTGSKPATHRSARTAHSASSPRHVGFALPQGTSPSADSSATHSRASSVQTPGAPVDSPVVVAQNAEDDELGGHVSALPSSQHATPNQQPISPEYQLQPAPNSPPPGSYTGPQFTSVAFQRVSRGSPPLASREIVSHVSRPSSSSAMMTIAAIVRPTKQDVPFSLEHLSKQPIDDLWDLPVNPVSPPPTWSVKVRPIHGSTEHAESPPSKSLFTPPQAHLRHERDENQVRSHTPISKLQFPLRTVPVPLQSEILEPEYQEPTTVDSAARVPPLSPVASSEISAEDLAHALVQERLLGARVVEMARRREVLLESDSASQAAFGKRSWLLWEAQERAAGVLAKRFSGVAARVATITSRKAELAAQLYKEVVVDKPDQTLQRAKQAAEHRVQVHQAAQQHAAEVEARRQEVDQQKREHTEATQRSGPHQPHTLSAQQIARNDHEALRAHSRLDAQAGKERTRDEQWEAFQASWRQGQYEMWSREVERFRALQRRQAELAKAMAQKRDMHLQVLSPSDAALQQQQADAQAAIDAMLDDDEPKDVLLQIPGSPLVRSKSPVKTLRASTLSLSPSMQPSDPDEAQMMLDEGESFSLTVAPVDSANWYQSVEAGELRMGISTMFGVPPTATGAPQPLADPDAGSSIFFQESVDNVAQRTYILPRSQQQQPQPQAPPTELDFNDLVAQEAQKQHIIALMDQARLEAQEARKARKQAAMSPSVEEKQAPTESSATPTPAMAPTPKKRAHVRPVAPGTLASLIPSPSVQAFDEGPLLDIRPAHVTPKPLKVAPTPSKAAYADVAVAVTPQRRPLVEHTEEKEPPKELRPEDVPLPDDPWLEESEESEELPVGPLSEDPAVSTADTEQPTIVVVIPQPVFFDPSQEHENEEEVTAPPTEAGVASPSPRPSLAINPAAPSIVTSSSFPHLSGSPSAAARSEQLTSDIRALSSALAAQNIARNDRDLSTHASAQEDISRLALVERSDPKKLEARRAEMERRRVAEAAGPLAPSADLSQLPLSSLFAGSTVDDWLAYIQRDRRSRTVALQQEFAGNQRRKQQAMAHKFKLFKQGQAEREEAIKRVMEEQAFIGSPIREEHKLPEFYEHVPTEEPQEAPINSPWQDEMATPMRGRGRERPPTAPKQHPAVIASPTTVAAARQDIPSHALTQTAVANPRLPRGAHLVMHSQAPASPVKRRQDQQTEKRARSRSPVKEDAQVLPASPSRSHSPSHSATQSPVRSRSRDISPSRLQSPDPPREETMVLDLGSTGTGLMFKQVPHYHEAPSDVAAMAPTVAAMRPASAAIAVAPQPGSSTVYFVQPATPVRGLNPLAPLSIKPQQHAPITGSPLKRSLHSSPSAPALSSRDSPASSPSGDSSVAPWASNTYAPPPAAIAPNLRTAGKGAAGHTPGELQRKLLKVHSAGSHMRAPPLVHSTPAIVVEEPLVMEHKPRRVPVNYSGVRASPTRGANEEKSSSVVQSPAASPVHTSNNQSNSARKQLILEPLDSAPSTPIMRAMQASVSSPALLPSRDQPSPGPSPPMSLRSSPRMLTPLSPPVDRRTQPQQMQSPPAQSKRTQPSPTEEDSRSVAAILSASRAAAAKASIPSHGGAGPRTMFMVSASASASPAKKTQLGTPNRGGRGLRDDDLRFAGMLTPTKSGGDGLSSIQSPTPLSPPPPTSSFTPSTPVPHSSFGAVALQIPRLLPPPHRPSPVKLLLSSSAALHPHPHQSSSAVDSAHRPAASPAVVSIASLKRRQ